MSRLTSRPIQGPLEKMNVTLKFTNDLSGGWLKNHHVFTTRVGIGIPKYQKYWYIPKFNSTEYRKCSIPKFQYYWILKKFQYWSSILPKASVLVTKIPKFHRSLILREKKFENFVFFIIFQNFQYSWVFSVFFGIQYRKCLILKKKKI